MNIFCKDNKIDSSEEQFLKLNHRRNNLLNCTLDGTIRQIQPWKVHFFDKCEKRGRAEVIGAASE